MKNNIEAIINEKIQLMETLKHDIYFEVVEEAIDEIVASMKKGGKIFLAGNGGSAADAQHFAGEIVGRFMLERKAFSAISLCVDPSVMTCIGNDYGYEEVFSRQVEGLAKKDDILIVISTSGNSSNLIKAVEMAESLGVKTVGLLGKDGGKLRDMCDCSLIVPSKTTPRIQEIHTFTVHIMCEEIERKLA